jgi:uncharacterized protein
MAKQVVQTSKLSFEQTVASSWPGTFIAVILGLALIAAEAAVLSSRGDRGAVYALIVILVASTISSITGFAFSALSGALLFHVVDSQIDAVQTMIVCSIAIQLLSVAALWRAIDWRSLGVFLIGGFLGVPAGVYLLLHLPTSTYRIIIGIILIVYAGYLLLRWPVGAVRARSIADVGAGFLGGITGGLAGFPGAFVTIWCGLKGWDKRHQRGVFQPFILIMQPMTLIAIHLMRPVPAQAELDWKTFAFVPAALLGGWLGLRIFKRLSDRQFELVVNALLVISGIALML